MRELWLACALIAAVCGQSINKVHLGFPETWDGDKYRELYCPSKNIPKWLDGYFLCQLSASYGNSSAPPGQRLNHMIDAIGAVASFHISNGQVVFSAQYYPARPYKIWEFYDRNMSKSSIPWAGWSDYNLTAMARWEQVPSNPDSARFHPNLDFWKIGNRVIAGTEAPYWVGYEFDVKTLNKFQLFPFTEENDIFGEPRPSMIPISMAIHERNDADGTIWGTFSAMNFNEQRFFQGIFTVDKNGVRRVVGLYDYGVWDQNACGRDDEYIGDKTLLPGYVHSITSTEKYIILPITSLLINPCKFKEPPMTNPRSAIQNGGLWGMDFYDMVPMRFLVFNKKTKEWVTPKPLEVVYDSHDPYVKYFYTDFLTSQLYPSTARILRFTLDVKQHRVMYSYLIPQETISADFPQINRGYEARAYQWSWIVEHPFAADNKIIKINVDDPSGQRNVEYKAESSLVLHEPWFVARPDSRREDDGVLLVRALDLHENKGVLLVLDATTMSEIGRAYVPINVPFGFHNRFFSKKDLGLPEGVPPTPQLASQFRPGSPTELLKRRPSSSSRPIYQTIKTTTTTTTTPRPQTMTTQKWTPYVTTTTEATTTTPPPTTTAKIPRWWPLASAATEEPWWQKVAPVSTNQISTENLRGNNATAIEDIYEETLNALCRWLPKVFSAISHDLCIQKGKQAAKWVAPLANSYAERFRAYKLTRTRTWWEDERKTLLAYGNEYGVAEARYKLGPASLRRWEGNRCTHVPPEVDRERAAARDLFLLFNNATFDQDDTLQVFSAQLEPQCVTLDVGNDGAGKLRAAVRKVTSILPGLQKLWLLIPYKVAEIAMLVDVKTPAITAQFALLEVFIRGLPADPDVLKQLNNTLETTLNTLIEQWQRREREIDNIALIALWKMVSAAGLPSMRTNWTHLCPDPPETEVSSIVFVHHLPVTSFATVLMASPYAHSMAVTEKSLLLATIIVERTLAAPLRRNDGKKLVKNDSSKKERTAMNQNLAKFRCRREDAWRTRRHILALATRNGALRRPQNNVRLQNDVRVTELNRLLFAAGQQEVDLGAALTRLGLQLHNVTLGLEEARSLDDDTKITSSIVDTFLKRFKDAANKDANATKLQTLTVQQWANLEKLGAYKLTRTRTWWEDERKSLLAYGNEYGYQYGAVYYRWCNENRCTHLRPGVDREQVAAEDFFILFNNATFDQLGVGPAWQLPSTDKYKIPPAIRAHTVMLSRPNEEHYAQMVELEPQCVTLDVGEDAEAGELRAAGLKKLWLLLAYEALEIAMLVDVKTPAITAHFTLERDYEKRGPPDPVLVKQLNSTLEATLNTLIEQWQRREREIDHIALITLWAAEGLPPLWTSWKRLCPGARELPAKLCQGKIDPYRIAWAKESRGFWLIRRGPGSHEGLLIGVKGPSFLLIGCDYNFRRWRTRKQCAAFFAASNKAQKRIQAAFAGDNPEVVEANRWPKKSRKIITDRLAATRRAELALKKWSKKAPYNSLPTREKAIDRLLYGSVRRGSSGNSFTPTMEFEPPEDQFMHHYVWTY
ncbi:unnamed protein product, partial [Mesorhabditis spiculigera]